MHQWFHCCVADAVVKLTLYIHILFNSYSKPVKSAQLCSLSFCHLESFWWHLGDGRLVKFESFFSSVHCNCCPSFPHPSICLVWVIAAAAVGAVAAFGHVQEGVLTRVQLGNPLPRNQEGGQVKKIHKHLVAITGKTYIGYQYIVFVFRR